MVKQLHKSKLKNKTNEKVFNKTKKQKKGRRDILSNLHNRWRKSLSLSLSQKKSWFEDSQISEYETFLKLFSKTRLPPYLTGVFFHFEQKKSCSKKKSCLSTFLSGEEENEKFQNDVELLHFFLAWTKHTCIASVMAKWLWLAHIMVFLLLSLFCIWRSFIVSVFFQKTHENGEKNLWWSFIMKNTK